MKRGPVRKIGKPELLRRDFEREIPALPADWPALVIVVAVIALAVAVKVWG